MIFRALGAFGVLALSIPAANADEPVLVGNLVECVKESVGVQGASGNCLRQALQNCTILPANQASSVGCFLSAKEEFSTLIGSRLEELAANERPQIRDIAGIEVRYDSLINFAECQRQRDLNRLADPERIVVEYQYAKCEASAAAQTYLQLMLKSGYFND